MSKSIKSTPCALSAPDRSNGVQWLTVGAAAEGQRIDNFLHRHLRGVPRSHIYRLLRSGQVRINGGRIRAHYRLRSGDRLRLPPVRTATPRSGPSPPPGLMRRVVAAVLREDAHFMFLDKPGGVPVHGGTGNPWGIIELLSRYRPELTQLSLAHRLDRETSGVLVLAKHRRALLGFQDALRHGEVVKVYQALLAGNVTEDRWRVSMSLARRRGEVRVDTGGKPAVSEFAVLRHLDGATLVRVRLHTGRMHQIRVHAAHSGHPVLGDPRYGDFAANRAWRRRGLRRLFLHAERLAFDWDGSHYEIRTPLPPELDAVVQTAEGAP